MAIFTMGFVLDGNSEIDARERRNLCYSICLRHLIDRILGSQKSEIFFSENTYFSSYVRNMTELPFGIINMS